MRTTEPVDTTKWSDYRNWSNKSKKWFDKNIPLYELDCLMGINPLTSSIHDYCMSLAEGVEVVAAVKVATCTTTTTSISSTPLKSSQNVGGYNFCDADFGTPPDFDVDDFDPVHQSMEPDEFDCFPVSSLADTFKSISADISLRKSIQ